MSCPITSTSSGLADLETILRDVVGEPELSPEEKDAHAAGTWAELDPDGIGVVAVHKLAWLIRQTWPELHRDDLYVKCFRTVVYDRKKNRTKNIDFGPGPLASCVPCRLV